MVLLRPPGLRGPKPYDREPIVRALIARHFLPRKKRAKTPTLTALCGELENNSDLREDCGFGTDGDVLSRSTFSRVHTQLTGSKYRYLLNRCILQVLTLLNGHLPDLGEEIAVDSTVIETYANLNRTPLSDPRATWTKVTTAKHPEGVWKYGYKFHTAVDANHGIPLGFITTTAKRHDEMMLIPLVEGVWADGFYPRVVIADRGYDSSANNEWLHEHKIAPVIRMRRTPSGVHRLKWTKLEFNNNGIPLIPLCECR